MNLRFAALALLAGTIGACAPDDAPAPKKTTGRYDGAGRLVEGRPATTARPNVILICLDTVRADGIEGREGRPPAMPAIADFCRTSTNFSGATGHGSWTAPCVTSILTGLTPRNHGVKGPTLAFPLVASVATMAEYMRSAGYATAAFTGGGWVTEEMGLGQGFDTFRPSFALRDPGDHLARWFKSRDRSKPYFLFLHTYEAHDPYGGKNPADGHDDPARVAEAKAYVERLATELAAADPGPNQEEFPPSIDGRELLLRWRGDPLSSGMMATRFGKDQLLRLVVRYTFMEHGRDLRRTEVEAELRRRYEIGLGFLDEGFAGLLRRIDVENGAAPTIVALTTDHGESFGENRNLGHGRWLTETLTKMLLVVRAPGRMPAGPVLGAAAGIDVLPTLLDLAGLPTPEAIDGQSLVPTAKQEPGSGTADRIVEAEEYRLVPTKREWGVLRLTSVRSPRAKVVVTADTTGAIDTEELFDLVADPGQERPLPMDGHALYGPAFAAAVAGARARLVEMQKEPVATGNWR